MKVEDNKFRVAMGAEVENLHLLAHIKLALESDKPMDGETKRECNEKLRLFFESNDMKVID